MSDTYWYALNNEFKAISKDSSHSKKISDDVYRDVASLEDARQVYTTFPNAAPKRLRDWVLDWLEPIRRKFRGGPIPEAEDRSADEPSDDSQAQLPEGNDDPDAGDEDLGCCEPATGIPPVPAGSGGAEPAPRATGPADADSAEAGKASSALATVKPQPTPSENRTRPALATGSKQIPDPRRRPDGKIDWNNVTGEFLALYMANC